MARKNRRQQQVPRTGAALPRDGAALVGARREPGPGRYASEDFLVRQIPSARATKHYRCPGCDQLIPPAVAHIVAWPADLGYREDDRRHWHSSCWQRR